MLKIREEEVLVQLNERKSLHLVCSERIIDLLRLIMKSKLALYLSSIMTDRVKNLLFLFLGLAAGSLFLLYSNSVVGPDIKILSGLIVGTMFILFLEHKLEPPSFGMFFGIGFGLSFGLTAWVIYGWIYALTYVLSYVLIYIIIWCFRLVIAVMTDKVLW